jgi:hypothetical protein
MSMRAHPVAGQTSSAYPACIDCTSGSPEWARRSAENLNALSARSSGTSTPPVTGSILQSELAPPDAESARTSRSPQKMRRLGDGAAAAAARRGAAVGSHGGARVPMLSEKELRDHFNMPLNEACPSSRALPAAAPRARHRTWLDTQSAPVRPSPAVRPPCRLRVRA